jgi:hypothetical protein
MQGSLDKIGDPARADGWYGYPDSLYTVALSATNFIGRVYIEASLAAAPTGADWFAIGLGSPASNQYLDFPLNPSAPTGLNGGDTSTKGFSFRGNYLYLRARVVRSHLYSVGISAPEIALLGDIRIVLSQSQTTYSSASTLPPVMGFTQLLNIGSGYQTFAGLNDAGIPTFRALAAGSGIALSQTATTITISNTGSGSTGIYAPASFLQLSDTPKAYRLHENDFVCVNSAGTGLAFVQAAAIARSGNIVDADGILPTQKGGTGLNSTVPNTVLYCSGTNEMALTDPPSVANTVLTWTGSAFAWLTVAEMNIDTTVSVEKDGLNRAVVNTLNFTGSGVSVTNDENAVSTINIVGAPQQYGNRIACYTIQVAYNSSSNPTSILSAPEGWNVTIGAGTSTIFIQHNLGWRLANFSIVSYDGGYVTTGEGTVFTQTFAGFPDNNSLQLNNMTNLNVKVGNSSPSAFIYVDLFFIIG